MNEITEQDVIEALKESKCAMHLREDGYLAIARWLLSNFHVAPLDEGSIIPATVLQMTMGSMPCSGLMDTESQLTVAKCFVIAIR